MASNVDEITIWRNVNKDVMEKLSACTGNVKQLTIRYSNNCMDWLSADILSRWNLRGITLDYSVINDFILTMITQTCTELTSIKLDSDNML